MMNLDADPETAAILNNYGLDSHENKPGFRKYFCLYGKFRR
jgi:hypothetical protein